MSQHKDQIIGEDKMQKMSVAPPDPSENGENDGEMTEEEELQEGLEESFPASDPPASTQPGHDQPPPTPDINKKDDKD